MKTDRKIQSRLTLQQQILETLEGITKSKVTPLETFRDMLVLSYLLGAGYHAGNLLHNLQIPRTTYLALKELIETFPEPMLEEMLNYDPDTEYDSTNRKSKLRKDFEC